MGYGTHCEYSLFGTTHYKKALSDTWLHFLEELYKRDPDGVRDCVPYSDWLETSNWFRHRWRHSPSQRAYEVADGLWARVDWCKRENVEGECWRLLEQLGRRRSDFVIFGFPDAATFLDDPRYVALVREFQKLQDIHEKTCKALDEAVGVPRQVASAIEAARDREHRPIDAFLCIKKVFMKFAEEGSSSTNSLVEPQHENEQ